MFPKKGRMFPGGDDRENGGTTYAVLIATALRTELGDTHRAAKTLMRWTGASERTVKHWLSGRNGPAGKHLLDLMRESETLFETVLTAAGRRDAVIAARTLAAHGTMVEVMALIKREGAGPASTGAGGVGRHRRMPPTGADDRENDRVNDRINDRVNPAQEDGLNRRQRWYLDALASGVRVRAVDLQHRWRVSEKTARRDAAALKARGMIEFIGSSRTGRYRLNN